MPVWWSIILIIFLAYSILAWSVYFMQSSFMFRPVPDILFTPTDLGLTYEKVALKIAREGEKTRKLPIAEVKNIRQVVAGVLSEEQGLPLERLLEAVSEAGFPELTKKHLVSILVADKTKRFRSIEGIWDVTNVS